MTEQIKKVVNVEILHLDELGYGPEGKHTRREWRAECLENLLAGKDQFLAWQNSWFTHYKDTSQTNRYRYILHYEDGNKKVVNMNGLRGSLDFIGQEIGSCTSSDYMFLVNTYFDFSTFKSDAFFMHTIFKGKAHFPSVIFKYTARFNGITFEDSAYFTRSKFENEGIATSWFQGAQFSGTIFKNDAWFDSVVFEAGTFSGASFQDLVYFDGAIFKHDIKFDGAKFFGPTSFQGVIFNNLAHFERTKFLRYYPTFRGCIIDSTRLEFSDESYFPLDNFFEEAIKNISFLKRLSDEHGQVDQALNFNAMELRAKRLNLLNTVLLYEAPDRRLFLSKWWETCFTLGYEKISDFGRSFTKPLFWLLVVLVISFIFGISTAYFHPPLVNQNTLHSANSSSPCEAGCEKYIGLSAYRAATEYSLYRSGNFLDFTDSDKNTASINMRLFGSEIEPWWARVFGFVKGIFTAILLFLIALGLRNKYRVS
jgi:hypothetical protein